MRDLSQGLTYIEHRNNSDAIAQSKISVDQSFERYDRQRLGLIWVADTQKCVPIRVGFKPQMEVKNKTRDEVYLMVHNLGENELPVSS